MIEFELSDGILFFNYDEIMVFVDCLVVVNLI